MSCFNLGYGSSRWILITQIFGIIGWQELGNGCLDITQSTCLQLARPCNLNGSNGLPMGMYEVQRSSKPIVIRELHLKSLSISGAHISIRVLLMLFGTPALCMRRCIGHELIVDYLFIGFTGDVVASMRNSCVSKLNRTGVVVVVRISLPNNPLVTYSGPSSDGLISDSKKKNISEACRRGVSFCLVGFSPVAVIR